MSSKNELRILDLFAGLGCSARELQKLLDKQGFEYTYVAIEIDRRIANAHRRIASKSNVIVADATNFLDPTFLNKFDFVWASPPCQNYSTLYRIKRKEDYGKDPTLPRTINALKRSKTRYVIENVKSPFTLKLKPDLIVGRHVFWTNLRIDTLIPIVECPRFTKIKNRTTELSKAYGIPLEFLDGVKDKRQALRNCLEPPIARLVATLIVNYFKTRS